MDGTVSVGGVTLRAEDDAVALEGSVQRPAKGKRILDAKVHALPAHWTREVRSVARRRNAPTPTTVVAWCGLLMRFGSVLVLGLLLSFLFGTTRVRHDTGLAYAPNLSSATPHETTTEDAGTALPLDRDTRRLLSPMPTHLFFLAQQIPRPPSSDWALGAFVFGVAGLLYILYRRAYRGRGAVSQGSSHDGGSVYVLSNPGHHNLVKIGCTTRGAEARAAELSSATGVPDEFEVEHEVEVTNPAAVEQAVHDRLADHKVNRDREFFEVTPQEARVTIDAVIDTPPSDLRRALGGALSIFLLLVTIALVTYHPADNTVVQSVPDPGAVMHLGSFFTLSPVQNALGLPGAWLAHALIPEFLGYLVLLPIGLLATCSYALLRGHSLRPLLPPTTLVLFGTLIAAAWIGWFEHALHAGPVGWMGEGSQSTGVVRWAGAAGLDLAEWLRTGLGPTGSLALLVAAAGGCVALLMAWWSRKEGSR